MTNNQRDSILRPTKASWAPLQTGLTRAGTKQTELVGPVVVFESGYEGGSAPGCTDDRPSRRAGQATLEVVGPTCRRVEIHVGRTTITRRTQSPLAAVLSSSACSRYRASQSQKRGVEGIGGFAELRAHCLRSTSTAVGAVVAQLAKTSRRRPAGRLRGPTHAATRVSPTFSHETRRCHAGREGGSTSADTS